MTWLLLALHVPARRRIRDTGVDGRCPSFDSSPLSLRATVENYQQQFGFTKPRASLAYIIHIQDDAQRVSREAFTKSLASEQSRGITFAALVP